MPASTDTEPEASHRCSPALVHPVEADEAVFILKRKRCQLEADAVFSLVLAVLLFVPLVPHFVYTDRMAKGGASQPGKRSLCPRPNPRQQFMTSFRGLEAFYFESKDFSVSSMLASTVSTEAPNPIPTNTPSRPPTIAPAIAAVVPE